MPRVHIHITGVVQGVGYRPFVWRTATALGLSGWVRNSSDGVHIEAKGPQETLDSFVLTLSTCLLYTSRTLRARFSTVRPLAPISGPMRHRFCKKGCA